MIHGKMSASMTSVELGTTDPSDSKPYLSGELTARSRWSRFRNGFKVIEGTMARFWPRAENVWRAMRDSLSFSGWLGVTATLSTGILALRYAYQSQVLAYKSMKLAEWTAKKDFLEMCQLANYSTATTNIECGRALRNPFPEPPYVNFDPPSSIKKRMMKDFCQTLSTDPYNLPEFTLDQMIIRTETANSANWAALCLIMIFCVGSLLVHNRRRLQRLFFHWCKHKTTTHVEYTDGYERHKLNPVQPHEARSSSKQTSQTSSALEHVAKSTIIRQRKHRREWIHLDIWSAAELGNVKEIQKCLDRGLRVDAISSYGLTPLIIASLNGRLAAVKHLLSAGAEVNLEVSFHSNALQSASMRGHGTVVTHLLTHRAKINSGALQIACQQGHEHIVRILIDWGVDVNSHTAKYPRSLRAAASGGYTDIVKILLHNGAASLIDVMINALEDAARVGHEKVVRLFLDPKINKEVDEVKIGFALLFAADGTHESIVDFLLNQLSQRTASNEDLPAILIAAAEKGFEKIVVALLTQGVDANRQRKGRRAIEVAAGAGHEEIVHVLLDHGAGINSRFGYQGPLEAAARGGYQDLVDTFLRRGADVNALDFDHHTPLSSAALNGHEAIVKLLLAHHADPNAKGDCCGNALKSAVRGGHSKIVDILLLHGADVNAECIFCGNTLQHAMSLDNSVIIKTLIDEGAELSAEEAYMPSSLRGSYFAGLKTRPLLGRHDYSQSLGHNSFRGSFSVEELPRVDDEGYSETDTAETSSVSDESFLEDTIFSMET